MQYESNAINLFGATISDFDADYEIPARISTGYTENAISIGTVETRDTDHLVEVDIFKNIHVVDKRVIFPLYLILALTAIFCFLIVRSLWRVVETILTRHARILTKEKVGHEVVLVSLVHCIFHVVLIMSSLLCTHSILTSGHQSIDSIDILAAGDKNSMFLEFFPVYKKLQFMEDQSANAIYDRFIANGPNNSIITNVGMDSMSTILDRQTKGGAVFGPDDLHWILRCFLCLRENVGQSRKIYHISNEHLFRSVWAAFNSLNMDIEVRNRIDFAQYVVVESGVANKVKQDLPLTLLSGLGVELQLTQCLMKSSIKEDSFSQHSSVTFTNLDSIFKLCLMLTMVSILRIIHEVLRSKRLLAKLKRKLMRTIAVIIIRFINYS